MKQLKTSKKVKIILIDSILLTRGMILNVKRDTKAHTNKVLRF